MNRRLSRGEAIACAAIFVLMAGAALPAWSDATVSASLSSADVRVGDTVQLTISVDGAIAGVSDPEIPEIDGLHVVSTGRSQNMSFGGGAMSASVKFTYLIQATKPGKYTVPPVSVRAGSTTLTTQVLALNVSDGGSTVNPAPPVPAPSLQPDDPPEVDAGETYEDVFVTTEVSNEAPWEGEQVVLTMSFFKRADVRLAQTPTYSPPETPGLVSEALPEPPQHSVMLGDAHYVVIQRKIALFAPTAQEYQIGPAVITYSRHFFDPEQAIESDPITIKIKALPADRPDGFCGLVGEMTAGLTVDGTRTRTGDTLTARVTVTGVGDVRRVQAPEVPVSGSCKVYEAGSQASTQHQQVGDEQIVGGVASFEFLLVPQETGTLTIGPVTMHYFEPKRGKYVRATTEAVQVAVAQGDAVAVEPEPAAGVELAYIKTGNGGLRARTPVTSHLWFWLIQLLPLAWLAVVARQRAEDIHRVRDPRYRRFVEARARARAVLTVAGRGGEGHKGAFELADEALSQFIADKVDVSAPSLSPDAAREELLAAGVGAEAADRVREMLRLLRAGRFGPGAAGVDEAELLTSVEALVDEVDQALGRGAR